MQRRAPQPRHDLPSGRRQPRRSCGFPIRPRSFDPRRALPVLAEGHDLGPYLLFLAARRRARICSSSGGCRAAIPSLLAARATRVRCRRSTACLAAGARRSTRSTGLARRAIDMPEAPAALLARHRSRRPGAEMMRSVSTRHPDRKRSPSTLFVAAACRSISPAAAPRRRSPGAGRRRRLPGLRRPPAASMVVGWLSRRCGWRPRACGLAVRAWNYVASSALRPRPRASPNRSSIAAPGP